MITVTHPLLCLFSSAELPASAIILAVSRPTISLNSESPMSIGTCKYLEFSKCRELAEYLISRFQIHESALNQLWPYCWPRLDWIRGKAMRKKSADLESNDKPDAL